MPYTILYSVLLQIPICVQYKYREKVWKGTNQAVYSSLVVCVSLNCNI